MHRAHIEASEQHKAYENYPKAKLPKKSKESMSLCGKKNPSDLFNMWQTITQRTQRSHRAHKAYENYPKAKLLKNKAKNLCLYVVKKQKV